MIQTQQPELEPETNEEQVQKLHKIITLQEESYRKTREFAAQERESLRWKLDKEEQERRKCMKEIGRLYKKLRKYKQQRQQKSS